MLVPRALADELLKGLLGVLAGQAVREGAPAGERLDALALAVEEQALEVDAGPGGGLGLGEVVGEQGGVLAETIEDGGVESGRVGFHATLEARTN